MKSVSFLNDLFNIFSQPLMDHETVYHFSGIIPEKNINVLFLFNSLPANTIYEPFLWRGAGVRGRRAHGGFGRAAEPTRAASCTVGVFPPGDPKLYVLYSYLLAGVVPYYAGASCVPQEPVTSTSSRQRRLTF